MSIAVAVKSRGQVVIAADSKRTFGSGAIPGSNLSDSKIRKVGSAYLAVTGWGVYTNILDDYVSRKKRGRLTDTASIFSFFRQFWHDLHDYYAFVNDQCSDQDSPFGDLDASFLIVNNRGIFSVACDMSVTHFDRYYAIGSGANYALGALHALYDSRRAPAAPAQAAVAAACDLDIYCGGKIETQTLALKKG